MEKIWCRGIIKYLHKKGLGPKDIHVYMVLILGDDACAIYSEQKWVTKFKWCRQWCRQSPEDDPRRGRPTTAIMQENIEEVHQLMMDDRRVTISQIASSVGISHVKVWYILHNELGMQVVSSSGCYKF